MALNPRPGQMSSLLAELPALFQEGSEIDQPNFFGRFLLAFERILLGLGESETELPVTTSTERISEPGLEEILGGIRDPATDTIRLAGLQRYFAPGPHLAAAERAPTEFLAWLAGWVALTLREDWDELRQRELIAKAVQLYKWRGTKRGMEEFLRIYTRLGVRIDELNTAFQLGVHATVGEDTLLDGGAPFFFKVNILLPTPDPALIRQQREIATAIIDLQKPAHTHYQLTVETPVFQLGVHSQIGIDTLLDPGGAPQAAPFF